ncbi:cleavage and polyadenylation specificity factor subunit 2 [Parastagonospora nodorum]|nr:cleavage and polyadenylation specificity factor subunit 2 [Parastagonospora nodorum]KAH5233093.1 cleavage and polyadenylation specificity factor subunit 2 [Parastagonospora nodorum]KAH6160733.1 cleavage and polyadenylation specificity factor subunit 2 [Parastagonospora nodorum]KAH6184735.1 cleavage and polyadenylation specificity factor subunit 2 [Parastagonospora nodorum]KAH6199173.1 cleavage and polyadenylation specificity factor subunit 2 [Parastagonospora nodorum]
MFNFTPLLGAQSSSAASQSLLEFDGGIKILIDVGWDESFDVAKLKEIERHVSTLSFVLLTHATTAHLGAYVHCCKNFPLFSRVPVYATVPVISLGRTLLQDLYASTPLASSILPTDALTESAYSFPSALKGGKNPNILLQAPTQEEIANYFGAITPLRYSQPHQPIPSSFSPPLNGLTITAYSAGHTLGGSIWHIQHGMESVVYAVDWNQAREHVLSGAAWLGTGTGGSEVLEQLRRPTAMICSSKNSGLVKVAKAPSKRDEELLSMIRDTVAKGGSVLIPCDSSARILEIAYLLEKSWHSETARSENNSPLKNAKAYLASRTGGATMRYVRSMLEWMGEGIVKEFEAASGAAEGQGQRNARGAPGRDDGRGIRTPFDFQHITLLEKKARVTRMLNATEPRVILASDTSLEWGFSKDAIRSLASDEKNLVILTERVGELGTQEKGLGRYLWDLWNERSVNSGDDSLDSTMVDVSGQQASISTVRTVALEGDEVPLYQQFLARQRQLHNTMTGDGGTTLETSADVVDDRSSTTSESSEESADGHGGKILNTTAALQHARNKLGLTDAELGVNILIRRKNVYDYEVRGKKGKEKLFPHQQKRRKQDDFGDLIRPEEFARADEEDNVGGDTLRGESTKKENTVGQKRRWDDLVNVIDSSKTKEKQRRRKLDGDDQGDTEMAESDSEPEDDPDKVDGPTKVIIDSEIIELRCQISFVDFSGLHDRRTIQNIIPLVKPRKLILIGGEEAETMELAEICRTALNVGLEASAAIDVFTPTIGIVVDASVDTNAWTVKLSRTMVRNLHWQNVRGMGVVAITGRLAAATLDAPPKEEEGSAKKKARLDAPAVPVSSLLESSSTPILDVVPANMATAVRSVAQPFHVGDLRLADLRKLMKSNGMEAEFRGEGVLVINGTVAVRKTATGQIEVDGGAYGNTDARNNDAATFFRVKRQIYDGLAVVAGS